MTRTFIFSRFTFIVAASCALIVGCQPQQEDSTTELSDDEVVVRLYDRSFSWEELRAMVPDNLSPEDSVQTALSLINNWIRKQAILNQAETNLKDENKNFNRQLEDYRNTLLIYAYEEQLLRSRLDTNISEADIVQYHLANRKDFMLNDYLVKVKMCIADNGTNGLGKIRRWLNSSKQEDLISLKKFCKKKGITYYLGEDEWLYLQDLKKKIPLEVYNPTNFLKKNKLVEFNAENRVFFVFIQDFRLKGEVAPVDTEKEKIKNMLLQQRRKNLLSEIREELYNNAIDKNHVEKFYE